jgi:hypothetical protein
MKTKTLLIAAAALAATVISSQAQVYSGVVGYSTLALTNGLTLIAPQLDYDGTGTNNSVVSLFSTNLVAPTTVLAWSPSAETFVSASWSSSKGVVKWTGNTNAINAALNSDQAIFVSSPAITNITVVGNVLQGTNIISLTGGLFNLVNGIAPVTGLLQTQLGYVPSVGDKVLTWNVGAQTYASASYTVSKGVTKWVPSEPTVTAGSGFFIETTTTPSWTNSFIAQ